MMTNDDAKKHDLDLGAEATAASEDKKPRHFIQQMIDEDMAEGGRYHGRRVHTRFPPEPNGFLHIGHAKAIAIDFGLAEVNDGLCNLRMDDTNPEKEDEVYVKAIQEDIKWLGYDWEDRFYHASDYFPQMYEYAVELIKKGMAYVDDSTAEEIRQMRGTLTEAGQNSPYRDRPVEESLDLFARMKAGEFPDGSRVLRAKIDMTSGNMNMRDPVMYRISHQPHHRTGTEWCIYPMYDWAHPIEDAIEGITHSLCSLEFEDHRPLYEWVVNNIPIEEKPRQIEFSRLGINYTVMSKRKLRYMVEENLVSGWDDPRMPTLSGLRRRGYTPASIRSFIEQVGVSKVISTVDVAFLEHCLREDLNYKAERRMAILDPVQLTITNYPDDLVETFEAENNPEDPSAGTRQVSFSKHLWIERSDYLEVPFKKYYRLFPGNEVRLKHAYVVKCTGARLDDKGQIVEVFAEYDPESRGGNTADGRRIRGTIQFVDQKTAVDAEVRLYDRLFTVEDPDAAEDYLSVINHDSLEVLNHVKLEASLADAQVGESFQFMRTGYFTLDNTDSSPDKPVFNRSVSLKDSFKMPNT